jgi:hypothetical protein
MTPRPSWPPLGRLLVDAGLITERQLAAALERQLRRDEPLGQILVSRGWVSRLAVAAALARQHGLEVEVRGDESSEPRPARKGWKPLGQLLIERGLINRAQLRQAIAEQARSGKRLGEILIERHWITAAVLVHALAEQEGVGGDVDLLRARVGSSSVELSERYELERRVGLDWQVVHASPTFIDATDVAFDTLQEEPEDALRIVRVRDGRRTVVWEYDPLATASASPEPDAEARPASEKTDLVHIYGYPVTDWGAAGTIGWEPRD